VLCAEYDELPVQKDRLSIGNVWKRDGGICQYTGDHVSRAEADIDHVTPLSRGGKNTWENMVVSKKELNRRKGNQLNSEIGYKLIRKPVAPKPVVIIMRKDAAPLPDQRAFLQD
jgi:5-methylcytosine-specific restriction endonuclease McrA